MSVVNPPVRGVMLASAVKSDANVQQTGAGNTNITGLSMVVPATERPFAVVFDADLLQNSSASGITQLYIKEGSTTWATQTISLRVGDEKASRTALVRDGVTGDRTFLMNLAQLITGNSLLLCSSVDPAYFYAVEL